MYDQEFPSPVEGPRMHQAEQREMRLGFGDGLAAAFELAATPAIFGFLGWLLDRHLDLFPVFTLGFALVAVAYGSWRLCSDYSDRMDRAAADRRADWQTGGQQI